MQPPAETLAADPPAAKVSRIWEIREAAERAYERGFFVDAAALYGEAWELIVLAADDPTYAQAPDVIVQFGSRLIAAHLAVKQPQQALEVYKRQRALLGPEILDYNSTLQYWWARVFLYYDEPKVEAAAELLRLVLTGDIDAQLRLEATVWLGHCLVELQQWERAIELLAGALERAEDPAVASVARRALISALLAAERYVEADKVIAAHFATAEGEERRTLALQQIQLKLGLFDPVGAFETHRAIFGESVDYLKTGADFALMRKLALDLRGVKEFEPAILVLERALPLLREEVHKQAFLLDLAETNAVAGHSTDALRHFRRFASLSPEDSRTPGVRLQIAQLLVEAKQFEQAKAELTAVVDNEAVEPGVRYQAAFDLAGVMHQALSDSKSATGMYQRAATLASDEPERAQAMFFAAEMQVLEKQYQEAAAQFEKVAELASDWRCKALFKRARAVYAAEEYQLAVSAFDAFLAGCPELADERPVALRQRASALFKTADYAPALKALAEFAEQFPQDPAAPQALLDAAQAAIRADLPDDAMQQLTSVVDRYADTEYFPQALYLRTYLQFQYGRSRKAEEDAFRFTKDFADSHGDLAPDVYLWLGDHFANQANYEQAESMFLDVRKRYKESSLAPFALYEAAKNAYQQARSGTGDFSKAQNYILQLFTHYGSAPARLRAQANFLRGDIATINGEFEQAAEWFQAAADGVPKTELYYASIGRMAECYYSLATETGRPEFLDKALILLDRLINAGVSTSIEQMARYRAARIYELQKLFDKAKNEYRSLFHSYGGDGSSDWYYFARAGFDLARLYEQAADYAQAERVYAVLAKSDIPVADEARKKAATLRELHLKSGEQF